MSNPPKIIRVNRDEFYANLVGKTQDGRQFFVTQPFVPYGNDFVACYMFDENGAFVEAKIHDIGKRTSGQLPGNAISNDSNINAVQLEMLAELGDVDFTDIQICPFEYEYDGVVFGLIAQPPEDEDEEWTVIAEPGNYMAFYPPWDGEYDT